MTRLRSLFLVPLLALPSSAAAVNHITGTITAARSVDAEHVGLWQYTIRFEWDLPVAAFRAVDLWLPVQGCECRCEDNLVRFELAKSILNGTRSASPCALSLTGAYFCGGDVPGGQPTARFETIDNGGCTTGAIGSGEISFFVAFPPGPEETVTAISIRAAGVSMIGRLSGTMPSCANACEALPVEASTWSLIKTTYR